MKSAAIRIASAAPSAAFHKANQQRAQHWPHAMLATATHDTKRGEDTRARLAALSEQVEEWTRLLPVWTRILRGPPGTGPELRPDRNDEYLLYQLLAGTWPCELLQLETAEDDRLRGYAERVRADDAEIDARGAGAYRLGLPQRRI